MPERPEDDVDDLDELAEELEQEEADRPRARRGRGGPSLLRLGEQLSGLLDPEGRLRRGQEVLGGMTAATKDEFVRIVGAEVRNFLEKMDAVDLAQQVVHGLTVDVNMQIKFSRSDAGGVKSEVTRSDAHIGGESGASAARDEADAGEGDGADDA